MFKFKNYQWAILLLCTGSLLYLYSCTGGDTSSTDNVQEDFVASPTLVTAVNPTAAHALDDTDYDSLFNAYPPHDVSSTNPSNKELAIFAWREMIALMWQSSYIASGSANQRATPDPNWNYGSDSNPFPSQPTVWETYAHRTEFHPVSVVPQRPFDSSPMYDFAKSGTFSGGSGSNAIFNFLDEDNEIGSCYLFSVEPQDSQMVMYQAKVNRSEYDYVQNAFANSDSLKAAKNRTPADIKANNRYFGTSGTPSNCDCPPGIVCFPCGQNGGTEEGAIEIKTAWRQANASDDVSQFFHREVMYLKNGASTPMLGTFLLIGMHIIHKTENMPEVIFATWEHESVTAGANSESYVYIPQGDDDDLGMNINEQKGVPATVKRLHPVDSVAYYTVSNTVHQMIAAKNPNHVLQNYRLVGVQAQVTDYPQRNTIPSYFLANFVIESDARLQDFYGSFAKPQDPTQRNLLDVSAMQQVTMGGCKGCHGVAQQGGGDFSFLFGPFPINDIDPYYVSFANARTAALK